MDEKYLSVPELAALLGVPRATIYNWRYQGLGPRAYRIGNRLLFSRSSVDEWLEQHSDPTPAA